MFYFKAKTGDLIQIINSRFFGHCGAFYGLKWGILAASRNKPLKSEKQIITRCKQPIKNRVAITVFVDVFLEKYSDCFSFYFLSALQSENNSNRVDVLGHKYILGPFQSLS